jgi:hypothetical protein
MPTSIVSSAAAKQTAGVDQAAQIPRIHGCDAWRTEPTGDLVELIPIQYQSRWLKIGRAELKASLMGQGNDVGTGSCQFGLQVSVVF